MKFFIVAILFAFAEANEKIIGGLPLNPNQVPYLVSIKRSGSFVCGGSLLKPKWVLTAAQCYASDLIVTAGDHSLSQSDGTEQNSPVIQCIKHPHYSSPSSGNDIMLLKVGLDFSPNIYVGFAVLPPANFDPAVGTYCNVYGWGMISNTGSAYSDVPYGISMKVISDADCDKYYHPYDSETMMCLHDDGEGSCHNDYGGPAICNGDLHGIFSYGYGCVSNKAPSVYTEVSLYINWINQYI